MGNIQWMLTTWYIYALHNFQRRFHCQQLCTKKDWRSKNNSCSSWFNDKKVIDAVVRYLSGRTQTIRITKTSMKVVAARIGE